MALSREPNPKSRETMSAMLMDSDVLMDSDEECAVIDRLVAQLVGMGFPRASAVDALRAARFDVAAATNRLLG